MPINTPHPDYTNWLGRWKKCRDAFAGEETVKSETTAYLPILSSHSNATDPKYLAYRDRAMFLGATQRTVEGLTGIATRKPYQLESSDDFDPIEEDIDTSGTHFEDLVKTVVSELLITSRVCLIADHNGDRAYTSMYPAENVTNWAYDDGNLSLLVLAEIDYQSSADDPYVLEEKTAFREFYLEDGEAWVQVWSESEKKAGTTDVRYVKDGEPVRLENRGNPLDHIPATFINPKGSGSEIVKPLLLDLVNVNLSHYRNSADYEHGLHFTALPTPWFSGISKESMDGYGEEAGNDDVEINIGSETAVLLPDPTAKAGMLEFTGAGLGTIKDAMNDKLNMMAMLGSRILEPQKRAAEAADTVRMNKEGDTSLLASLIASAERGLQRVLDDVTEWGELGDVEFQLDRDMMNTQIDPQTITALLSAVQACKMSLETFVYNMKSGELLPNDVSVEDEIDRIDAGEVVTAPPVIDNEGDDE